MAGVIESVIKTSPLGRWYIELTDSMKEDEEPIICLDVFEYADKIEEMGDEYGGDVEVIWSSEENVTPEQINEVRMQMNAYEAEQEAKRNGEEHMPDGTPSFEG
jgi:recombinational DNA repair protein RecT